MLGWWLDTIVDVGDALDFLVVRADVGGGGESSEK
jgi:hypothetical protein